MDAATQTDLAIDKAKGRKDNTGQVAVIKMKVVEDRIADLVALYEKAAAAKDKLSDAINAVAEATGLHTATVNKFVAARAGESFEEVDGKVQQLALVFSEIGPVKGSRGGTN